MATKGLWSSRQDTGKRSTMKLMMECGHTVFVKPGGMTAWCPSCNALVLIRDAD